MKREPKQQDLGAYLDETVYPALFARLDTAFPAFGWTKSGSAWVATSWPSDFPFLVGHENPERLMVYADRPHWVKVHGHAGVRFLDLVNGGRKPAGPEFPEAVRSLCGLAGVPFPEREVSQEEVERRQKAEARRAALEVVTEYAQETLFSPAGAEALAFLTKKRGFTEEAVRELGLGFYDSVAKVSEALKAAGVDAEAARDSAVLWSKLEGYVLIPWADSMGHPLTLYGAWPSKPPPEGKPPKIALPGEGTKGSPLYFDRARKAGHKELVAVEGVFDAALLQARGDSRVVAYVAAQFSGLQVETMARHRIRSVVICPDPDSGGDKGALSSVESLTKAGIAAYVAPRLPDGLDPDEFLLREGLEGWKAHVQGAVSGAVYRTKVAIGNLTPDSPEADRRLAVEKVLSIVETLRGDRASLEEDEVLRLTAERTGFSPSALAVVAEDHAARRRKEDTERTVDSALRDALAEREKGGDPLKLARKLADELARVQAKVEDPPPSFSVDRFLEESLSLPEGKPSGWDKVDKKEETGGLGIRFHAAELSVIVGRPSHAKTASLVNLFHNWLKAGTGDEFFLFYSFEEPEPRIVRRLLSILTTDPERGSGWTQDDLRFNLQTRDRGTLPHSDLTDSLNTLRSWEDRLQIVFRPGWSVEQMTAHARTVAKERTVGGVFVDYWQKVPPPGDGSMTGGEDRRDIALAVVGRHLKALAVELSCPVVAGAQAGRKTATEAAKIPAGKPYEDKEVQDALRARRFTMEDIREGGIEQEVDLALGLLNFRADYKSGEEDRRAVPETTRLEVGILKSRNVPPGRWVGLAFEGRYGLIRDPSRWDEV